VSHAGGAHSDEDDQDYDNDDGEDEDSDNDNSDDENNSESDYAPRDDEESDDDNSKCDSHCYFKFIDSSLILEDEEPPESYCVDWVKGKGAGRKANKGRLPRPDTTLMTADGIFLIPTHKNVGFSGRFAPLCIQQSNHKIPLLK
jgi:hypothetical protein